MLATVKATVAGHRAQAVHDATGDHTFTWSQHGGQRCVSVAGVTGTASVPLLKAMAPANTAAARDPRPVPDPRGEH